MNDSQPSTTTPAPLFDHDRFQATVTAVAARFEKLAPTVADYCDWLAAASLHEITLADVRVLEVLVA